jgi:hypothetical protein
MDDPCAGFVPTVRSAALARRARVNPQRRDVTVAIDVTGV